VSEPIAAFYEVSKVYGTADSPVAVEALRGITLEFKPGESVAILGPSGSGKSTMMNIIGCLDQPTGGQYVLGGVDVSDLDDDGLSDIRGRRVGFVFQNFNLIHQLTVLENLEVPLFYQSVPAVERRRRATRVMEMVDLVDRAHHRPMELSGGQQQRAAIARALINDPLIILADEPTGNLDSATGEMILSIFDQLHAEGKTIIMVTHEADVARRYDRNLTLRDGRVEQDVRRSDARAAAPQGRTVTSGSSERPAFAHGPWLITGPAGPIAADPVRALRPECIQPQARLARRYRTARSRHQMLRFADASRRYVNTSFTSWAVTDSSSSSNSFTLARAFSMAS